MSMWMERRWRLLLQLTVHHHVVADDGGRVEGPLPGPHGGEARAEGCPEAAVHMEGVRTVDPNTEPGWGVGKVWLVHCVLN